MIRYAATAFAAFTALLHSLVGTYDTLLALLEADLDPALRGTFHACWHFISLFLLFSAYAFWRRRASTRDLAALWIGFAVVFFGVGLWQGGLSGLMVVPQWILLAPAGVLAWLSARRAAR